MKASWTLSSSKQDLDIITSSKSCIWIKHVVCLLTQLNLDDYYSSVKLFIYTTFC